MDRSPVGMTWARRVGFAAALGWNVWLAQPIAAQTPDAAEPVPAARPSRILGTLQKFRPPQRTLVVLRPDAEGVWREEEVSLAPDAVVIVDGMETPAAGLQSGRPVVIERRAGAPMRIVQGVLPPSRTQGVTR